MKLEVDVKGFKEMRALLKQLPLQVERRFVDASARLAMKPVLEDAKANLRANGSVRSGATVQAMKIKSKKLRDGTRSTRVGPDSKVTRDLPTEAGGSRRHRPSQIAHLIERGTSPHTIKPKKAGGKLRLLGGDYVDEVSHPGSEARPFMEPAFDKNKSQALRTYGLELAKRVKRWIERNRRV